MEPIVLNDPADSRLNPYRDIRERDLVGRQNRFIAEGKVVLDVLVRSPRFETESILLLEKRLPLMRDTIAARPDIPVYLTDSAIMDSVAGFEVHRGILAIGRRLPLPSLESLIATLPENALVVVCEGISNHDNIGAIFRNAAAFGAAAVLLDDTCCDPLYRKSLRVSVGGVLRVPYARIGHIASLPDRLAASGFRQLALSPAGRTDIRTVARGGRTAFYIGAEGPGLPKTVLDKLETVRIAISPGFDSLNAAASAAIALYQLSDL